MVDFAGLDLPKLDYAEYLTNTVYFAFSPLYYLFDKSTFLSKLRDFYSHSRESEAGGSNLWHVQMLCVFGLGHAILARGPGRSGPMGSQFLARAVEALPDAHRLGLEEVIAVEVLIILSLFMQAMDMRLAAYNYVTFSARHDNFQQLTHFRLGKRLASPSQMVSTGDSTATDYRWTSSNTERSSGGPSMLSTENFQA